MKQFIRCTSVILLLVLSFSLAAQESKKGFKYDLYGFVRTEVFLDSYKGVSAAEDLFYLVPLYIGKDSEGNDLNQQLSTTFAPLHTRFGFSVNGPDLFGAKTKGVLETDFFGIANAPTVLRLRLAYIQLNWERASLLAGQDWHPFFTKQCFPHTTNLSAGTPFNAFGRTPLVRYDYFLGNVTVTGAAIFELQYGSLGPLGRSAEYAKNANIPELLLGIEYHNNAVRLGGMIEYKMLQPRMFATDTLNSIRVTDKTISGFNYAAYAEYKKEKLTLLAKGFFGGLTTHMLMQGGFGVTTYNPTTGEEGYTPFHSFSALINGQYGGALKVGGFLGYAKNLGSADPLYDFGENPERYVWGRFLGITEMYRGSVSLWYNINNVSFRTEYEVTTARYGDSDRNLEDGLFNSFHNATNKRFNLAVLYLF